MSATPAARPFSCGVCGTKYVDEAWGTLDLSQRIAPAEVRRVALDWPDDVCVEVRFCRSCKASIATKRRWPSPPG